MLNNISVSSSLKLSRKEYVSWKGAVCNSLFFSLHTLLLSAVLENTKETRAKPETLPFKAGVVSSPFWIAAVLGGQDTFSWELPVKGVKETNTLATKQLWWVPQAGRGAHTGQRGAAKRSGLDNEPTTHGPSVQWFWCNFWQNWSNHCTIQYNLQAWGRPSTGTACF